MQSIRNQCLVSSISSDFIFTFGWLKLGAKGHLNNVKIQLGMTGMQRFVFTKVLIVQWIQQITPTKTGQPYEIHERYKTYRIYPCFWHADCQTFVSPANSCTRSILIYCNLTSQFWSHSHSYKGHARITAAMETAFLKPYNTKNKNPCSLLLSTTTAADDTVVLMTDVNTFQN